MRTFERSLARSLAVLLLLAAGLAATFAEGPDSVAELARNLSPAVVNISTTRSFGVAGVPFPDAPDGSPLRDFFDDRNPNSGGDEEALGEARSLGSGFIIDRTGLIVTNNHVIDEATEIVVFLSDGTRLEAQVVGADDKTDLAVLKVAPPHDLTFVKFGDSDRADIGDWVMAIGNPFGLGGSVTLGIVSARNRDIHAGPYDNFIQTDAAINQGNSGGPLFDMDGKVVGINTAIYARGGGGLGIGFAVPANLARPVVEQLAAFGETRRGWLGVGIQDVSYDIAASLGLPNTHGALVVDVTANGPSDGTLRDGDIILAFNDRPIVEMRDLPRFVAQTAVGKEVPVHVLRDGQEMDLPVKLGRLEPEEKRLANIDPVPDSGPMTEGAALPEKKGLDALVGLTIEPLSDDMRELFGIDADVSGMVITSVEPGSDAEDKGLLAGLMVQEVNQRQVKDVGEVTDLVGAAREEGRPAVLFKLIDPSGGKRFVAVRLN